MSMPPRLPLHEFLQDESLLAALRKGVRAMKARKPSDPLSWFFQAAIHGVPDTFVEEAVKADPAVASLDRARYWNQCPHGGQHSANFLPWHRGYTYHFEQILRMHTEHEGFSLPYWDYEPKHLRKFPRAFGIEHLDGDFDNNAPENINPLFHPDRDFYFAGYEHPLTDKLPYLELSDAAVDWSPVKNAEVFFGETETEGVGGGLADDSPGTRGLLESFPHDPIHRVVGGIIGSGDSIKLGAMAVPMTAGFDPIFCVHHSNIDRLWVEWSCLPGKRWGKLPPAAWMEEAPWYFFDTDGREVVLPRKHYFDHRRLGVRFKYEDLTKMPLELPSEFHAHANSPSESRVVVTVPKGLSVVPVLREAVAVGPAAVELGTDGGSPEHKKRRFLLRLHGVNLGVSRGAGFDVHLSADQSSPLDRTSPSFVGSIGLFVHAHAAGGGGGHGGGHHEHPGTGTHTGHGGHAGHEPPATSGTLPPADQIFDATHAIAATPVGKLAELELHVVPFSLVRSTVSGESLLDTNPLILQGFDIVAVDV